MEQSDSLAKNFKQKTPESISEEDLLSFSLRDVFEQQRTQCQLLYHVLCGSMGLGEKQLKVTGSLKLICCYNSSLRTLVIAYLVALEQQSLCRSHSVRSCLSVTTSHILGVVALSQLLTASSA